MSKSNSGRKRKRGSTPKVEVVVIDLDQDQVDHDVKEPAGKRVALPPLPPPPLKSGDGGAPDSTTASPVFRVPTATVTKRKVKHNDKESPATVEQERQSNNCRTMRKAVLGVIFDVHDEIERCGVQHSVGSVGDLLTSLWVCWRKYPLMFSSVSKIPKICGDEDLSTPAEIRDFMFCWLHGLSSLILRPALHSYSREIVKLLATYGQMLIYGNPGLVQVAFIEVLKVISTLISNGRFQVPLEYMDGQNMRVLVVSYEVPLNDFDRIADLLGVLRSFIPPVFHFRIVEQEKLVQLFHNLWTKLSNKCKFKMLKTFLLPVIPSITNEISLPTEISLVCYLEAVVTEGKSVSDLLSLFNFQRFCDKMGNMDVFPPTLLLRFHSFLSNLIASDSFDKIDDDHSSGIIQLYWFTGGNGSKANEERNLVERDVCVYKRAAKTLTSFQTIHPLLENTIFSEVQETFNRRSIREGGRNWAFHPNSPGLKDIIQVQLQPECSLVWIKVLGDFQWDTLLSLPFDNFSLVKEILKKSSFLIQLASRVNRRLMQYAVERNGSQKLIFVPNLEFLDTSEMIAWTEFVVKLVTAVFSGTSPTTIKDKDDLLCLILDTISSFHNGRFCHLRLPLDKSIQLVCVAGLPWFFKCKTRLSKTFLPSDLFSGVKATYTDMLQPSTKAKCMSTLCLAMFLPWRDFVLDVLSSHMEPVTDADVAKAILQLIMAENWAVRSLSWSQLLLFIHRVQSTLEWRKDSDLRNNLASAIVKLPCFYTNQELCSSPLAKNDRKVAMRLLLSPCPFCAASEENEALKPRITDDPGPLLAPVPEAVIQTLLRMSLPILRDRFKLAKITLCKLITVANTHTVEYCHRLISEFATTVAQSGVCVGTEVIKALASYLQPREKTLLYQEYQSGDDRGIGIDLMFNTFTHFLYQSYEKKSSVGFSSKMLIVLRELAPKADLPMTIEVLKYSMRLIMHRDSNVRNILSQTLCIALATRANCMPWELMTRLRYDLARNIVALILDEFCNLVDHTEEFQSDRVRAFLSSVSITGEFRTTSIFIHHYYPILLGEIIPYLHTDPRYRFVLKCMSDFASLPAAQLLQDGYHNCYRVLVLNFGLERTNTCFKYLKQDLKLDTNFLAANAIQGTVNEMLCYLGERKSKVLKFIPPLFKNPDDDFVVSTPTRSEIQELLYRHLMGFFLYVDTKLHSRLESVTTKRRILFSFKALIELMGKTRITQNRSKVYATLNSLFCLGPEFYDLLFESWRCFAMNLENSAFGQMSAQILAAVCTLHDYLPSQVENLIIQFIHVKKELTSSVYHELYFVTDFTKDPNVLEPISKCISDMCNETWLKFFALLVRESFHENSHIRLRAIHKLHYCLENEYEKLKTKALDTEHSVVSQLLTSFLSASRDADKNTLMLLSESFGLLGAVDPYRFRNSKDEEMRRKSTPVLTVEGPAFAVKYLDVIIREFQESDDTTDFDYCACLIQQLLQHFQVQPEDYDPVWGCLPRASRELVEPLLKSKYKVEKTLPKLNVTCPIYLSEHGKVFDQWLSHWLTVLSACVKPGTKAHQLVQFSKYMVPRNNRIASFLLPYVATYAVIYASPKQKKEIVLEIETILTKWIEQDKMKINSQILVPVKESQADLGTPDPEQKVIYDEDVIQYRCTQEVFCVFDHLFRAVRQAKRVAGLERANQLQQKRRPPDASLTTNPCLSEDQAEIIGNLLARIPMNTVSQVAFHCEDYRRALFYVEQDLKKHPFKLQDQLNYLQQLYRSLNDMDSVIGVAAVRKREPTMSEIVCESFAKGKVESGVRSLELMVYEDPDDLIATNGLLQAYLSLDEPRKAETLIKGCVSRNPHWEVALEEFQIEATWKLRDWSSLRRRIHDNLLPTTQTQSSSSTETQPTWTMTVCKILSLIQVLEVDTALQLVNDTRLKLMNPLVAAANDYNAYSRSYANVVQLHILTEVEQVINFIYKSGTPNFSLEKGVKELIDRWTDREQILFKSQKFVDPVLNVRKSLLEILKDLSIPEHGTLELFNASIRDCWLTAGRVESKAGNFTRAYNCIAQAKKYMSAKVMFEHAKLLSRKGDKEQALQILQTSVPSFFPKYEEWKLSPNGNIPSLSDIEDRKLCSYALLLQSKLSDELQLLDIEKNIKNYENCIRVFKESEKNFFTLAGYYDRLYSTAEDKAAHSSTQEKIVRFYANSLHYGCKYVYQSLPRLLSIWFDFAAIGMVNKNGSGGRGGGKGSPDPQPSGWQNAVTSMQTTIKTLSLEVPAYVLLTAFSQLISRICHANPNVWELLKEIIGLIICTHPHQTLWMTMAVSKSSYKMRESRCMDIYMCVEKKKPALKRTILDYTLLADKLIELCVKDVQLTATKTSMSKVCPALPRLLASSTFGDVLVPFQVFMSPSLPPSGNGHKNYDAFPQKFVFIKGVEDNVDVMNSLVRPKRICLIGSDGRRYGLLCKAKDDLRKDCKVMEVNNVVNWYLHRNPESRQRQLRVRIYGVTPLNEAHGLLEWVPNLSGIRGSTLSLYRDRGYLINTKELKSVFKQNDTLEVKHKKFVDHFLKPFPPVFSDWFLNNFNDPQSWYKARMSYIRTAAVMSIVGFILGLGDRHGENILIDSSNGDIVHVDFNCLFNKGETFDTPERVPFRLTQNVVEAMGPLGVEGVFRRSCEITMGLFRQHKDVFLSVLRPFVFDPLVEWEVDNSGSSSNVKSFNSTVESTNLKAVEHLKHIENRINGSARNFTMNVNTELSIEAQVAYLIDEARSIDNLCRMFLGWTPFI